VFHTADIIKVKHTEYVDYYHKPSENTGIQ